MAKIDPANCTLLELALLQTRSHLKAARLAAYVIAWGRCRADLGHDPTTEEYAEWWGQSVRTAYRELALFREAFPTLDNPGPLVDRLEEAGPVGRSDFALAV